ncbi:MAG: zinc ribbon domain-containing protein, partial [Anaerolineales bacterium]|nr:zinc ribbon domain-containing protein [Anaerolineales bacterium]
MPDVIKCPSCGESNLPDQEFCQYCQARLQPLTGTLMGEDAPIKSGELPTKKNTAELEPILPQWLRDARESARQDDPTTAQLDLQQPPQLKPASVTHDLLAGLQSQAGDEEEDNIPDWLASITGHTSKSTKSQSQSSDLRRVELGGRDDFAKNAAAEISSDKYDSSPAGLKSPEPQPDENNEVRDWFRNLGNSEQAQQSEQPESIENSFSNSPANDGPDWLTQTVVNENAQSEGAAPAHDSTDVLADAPEPASDAPDWLRVTGIQNETTTGTDSAGD